MVLHAANSDMKNGLQKLKNVPWKKFIYSGNWKLQKIFFRFNIFIFRINAFVITGFVGKIIMTKILRFSYNYNV